MSRSTKLLTVEDENNRVHKEFIKSQLIKYLIGDIANIINENISVPFEINQLLISGLAEEYLKSEQIGYDLVCSFVDSWITFARIRNKTLFHESIFHAKVSINYHILFIEVYYRPKYKKFSAVIKYKSIYKLVKSVTKISIDTLSNLREAVAKNIPYKVQVIEQIVLSILVGLKILADENNTQLNLLV